MHEEPRDPASPFAALILDYMWNQRRPPITANRLATELRISRQTVTNWLAGKKPQPEMLTALSRHTGIPLKTLYEAAGYPVPEPSDEEDVVERIMRMSPDERRQVLDRIDAFLDHVHELEAEAESESEGKSKDEMERRRPKVAAGAR